MRIGSLAWDEINLAHIGERDISRTDVEAICRQRYGPIVRAGRAGRGERERLLVVGLIEGGEFITVVLKPLGRGKFRPITAWVSMSDERRRWLRDQRRKGRR